MNNNKFLEYIKNNSIKNMNHIKSIRINKNSISVTIYNTNFFLNNLYDSNALLKDILFYLNKYLNENESEYLNKPDEYISSDYLEYKFKKINIKNLND